ncbi:unnamed protein product [Effrenium voratum]|nr:unnamed protein product [Effrenium voratum]
MDFNVKTYGSAEWQPRQGLSCRALAVSTAQLALLVLAPWALFASLCWGLMSRLVYLHSWLRPILVVTAVALVFLMVGAAFMSRSRWLRKGGRIGEAEPRFMRAYVWWAALAMMCLVALVAGVVVGNVLAGRYMHGYYDLADMAAYDNVNPARSSGKQLLDAGRVVFTKGAHVDLSRSVAYQNSSLFCVAPIVGALDQPLPAIFDVWAAGKDCCGGPGNFTCGAAGNAAARGGLRLVGEEQIYRAAVQYAELTYHLESRYPIFFEWTADPIGAVSSKQESAFAMYFVVNLLFLLCTFFLVVTGYACYLRSAKR